MVDTDCGRHKLHVPSGPAVIYFNILIIISHITSSLYQLPVSTEMRADTYNCSAAAIPTFVTS